MKKVNIGAVICSVLILICACGIGAVSVSALSMEGQIILSELASAGTSLGFDIGSLIPTTAETTTENQYSAADAEEQLGTFLDNLNVSLDITTVTDMIAYLQNGHSFADWVYSEYGDTVDIPESVREMSTGDVIMYLLGTALNSTESTAQAATSSDYVFAPSSTTQESAVSTSKNTNSETESRTSVIIYPSNETSAAWKTGDVNNDGDVTAADARLALRASATLDILSGKALDAADVNGDGVVTAKDARSILRYAAKITNSF